LCQYLELAGGQRRAALGPGRLGGGAARRAGLIALGEVEGAVEQLAVREGRSRGQPLRRSRFSATLPGRRRARSRRADLPSTFDNTPPSGAPGVLFAFAGADRARALAALPPAQRRAAVLEAFVAVVNAPAAQAVDFLEVQWADEQWSTGGPGSCAPPGLLTDCGHVIRDPVGPIHWAGTETAVYWTGYIDGAVRSGERAADEVLEELTEPLIGASAPVTSG
jgi:hypothetical protein